MKAVIAAFTQEKALVGAFSVIVQLHRLIVYTALVVMMMMMMSAQVMMRNHQHILSIRKRCAKAKEELSINLHTRLKWVMYIQRQMAEQGHQLVMHHEELRRLSRRSAISMHLFCKDPL